MANLMGCMELLDSERQAHAWRRNPSAPGERIKVNFDMVSDRAWYRVRDPWFQNREAMEPRLLDQDLSRFSCTPTVAFDELPHTGFEGMAVPEFIRPIRGFEIP